MNRSLNTDSGTKNGKHGVNAGSLGGRINVEKNMVLVSENQGLSPDFAINWHKLFWTNSLAIFSLYFLIF